MTEEKPKGDRHAVEEVLETTSDGYTIERLTNGSTRIRGNGSVSDVDSHEKAIQILAEWRTQDKKHRGQNDE